MTTDNGVSAQDDIAVIAADVSAAAATPVVTGEPQAPEPQATPGVTLSDLENTFKSYEGRQANYTSGRFRDMEANLNAKINEELAPLRELVSRSEQAQVEQLDESEQIEYWKNKSAKPAPEPQQPAPVAVNADQYSSDDRLAIINNTTAMLTQLKLNIPYTDERLWAGATNGMSQEQLLQVARTNAVNLGAAPPPAQVQTQQPPATPPSTQAAPASTGSTYGSRTEANAALLRGDIKDIDAFKAIGLSEGWLKQR